MVKCYISGLCEHYNPGGEMGIAVIVVKDDKIILNYDDYFFSSKKNSNHAAVYLALEALLEWVKKNMEIEEPRFFVYSTNELLINQMNGKWAIKEGLYKNAAMRCANLLRTIKKKELTFRLISKDQNAAADQLAMKWLPPKSY